jgi:hypothetical protein
VKLILGAVALLFVSSTASAQVGHSPENSPFRDIEGGQELTFFGGHFNAGADAVGSAPKPGAILGLLYQIHVGGPANLMVRYARVSSSRAAVDPTLGIANRSLGVHPAIISLYDVDIGVNLTGMKSYHRIVPTVNFGAGVASCTCTVDKDPFTFGTPFAISLGAGLRYVPGGHFQIRVDLNDYLYQLKTPGAYYINSADNTPVAAQGTARTFWKNNPTLTVGVSRLFFR